MASNEGRSLLRVRSHGHSDPARDKGEWIVEVWRDAQVVATIYGSREGVHIVSERFNFETGQNSPFGMDVDGVPSVVVPLLEAGETCPWCSGSRKFLNGPCPLCARRK